MSSKALADTKLNQAQISKATTALLAHHAKSTQDSNDLLASEEPILLVITTKKASESGKTKPIRISLKHSLLTDDSEVCLITKDPQDEYKRRLESAKVGRINKVLGVSKLKAKYKPYEAKRALCSQYGVFLADDRVLPLLPKLLGKTFFDKKKQPLPVCLSKGNIKTEIDRALHSTRLHHATGSCTSVRIGHTGMSSKHVKENILHAVPEIVEHIGKKWRNIQCLSIKTSTSTSLPIYNSLPDDINMAASGKTSSVASSSVSVTTGKE
ncbi:MAG: ribosomal protein L1 [Piptocephalis tieghemiana]|nr:MAG: ribosomal protein L1 [Piptocephalis tieghemiana]